MTTGDEQREAWSRQRSMDEGVDSDVGREVVDAVQRLVQCERVALCSGYTDEQRTGQAGAGGHGDRVELFEAHAGISERAVNRRHHRFDVRARCNLRHDATETRMLVYR